MTRFSDASLDPEKLGFLGSILANWRVENGCAETSFDAEIAEGVILSLFTEGLRLERQLRRHWLSIKV